MDEYKPNSNKFKQEQKKKGLEKVVSGSVIEKKKSELEKLGDAFIVEDVKNVKSAVFRDVFVPAVKRILLDIANTTLSMMLYGEVRDRGNGTNASRVSYSSISSGRSSNRDRDYRQNDRSTGYNRLYFESRGDAEEILDAMLDLLDQYQAVSVADFYDLAGLDHKYTDNDYGWTDLSDAKIISSRDGHRISFPKAIELRR